MRKFTPLVFSAAASFALAACGHADDASQDAQADSVEIPADQALANTPEPAASAAVDSAAEDATKAAETSASQAADAAESAAADATAAAKAAETAADTAKAK
jgi:hypothetical protein